MALDAVIETCDEKDVEGLIVAVDFEKSFDSVNWDVYNQILKAFNFGESFIKKVQNVFQNTQSCTINDFHQTGLG